MKITKNQLRHLIQEATGESGRSAAEELHHLAIEAGKSIAKQQSYISRGMLVDPPDWLIDTFVEEAEYIRETHPELVAQAEAEGINVDLEWIIEQEGFTS